MSERRKEGAATATNSPAEISPELLAKLAPHRVHESSWLKNLSCSIGLHRWYSLDVGSGKTVSICRWCPKVKVDGVVYGD